MNLLETITVIVFPILVLCFFVFLYKLEKDWDKRRAENRLAYIKAENEAIIGRIEAERYWKDKEEAIQQKGSE